MKSGGRRSSVWDLGIEWNVLPCIATDFLEGNLDWREIDGVVDG